MIYTSYSTDNSNQSCDALLADSFIKENIQKLGATPGVPLFHSTGGVPLFYSDIDPDLPVLPTSMYSQPWDNLVVKIRSFIIFI